MSNNKQSGLYQEGGAIAWETAAPGIQRQVFGYDETMMLVKVKFEKAT